ncbi:MAG: YicC family protein [Lentisphaerae bacterium]|jgi:uncharacterized protein (TIGR00255 family)|nr:YicC family protein [Lentisphaerota bacterium]
MKSMTGYGRATASADGCQVTIEISAVNSRKQVDMRFTIPRELGMLEPILRKIILEKLSRGSIQVVLSYKLDDSAQQAIQSIDHKKFALVSKELKSLAAAAGLPEPTISDILLVPGVLSDTSLDCQELIQNLSTQALQDALADLDKSRVEEGLRLKDDLMERGKLLTELVEKIAARADDAVILQKARLQERIEKLGVEITLDDERLVKELAFHVEKADITEETVRLQSHLVKYKELLNSEDDAGRNLDFLGQEMNREANTLSAKTADMDIATYALTLKTEIARIREQVMNIE